MVLTEVLFVSPTVAGLHNETLEFLDENIWEMQNNHMIF